MNLFLKIATLLIISGSLFAKTQLIPDEYQVMPKKGLEKHDIELITQSFQKYWDEKLLKLLNKELSIQIEWDSSRIDAYATRDMEDNLIIVLGGALIKKSAMSAGTLQLILCHELGHYIGGAPKSLRGRSSKRSWSSAEGQADYFAINKCLMPMLRDQPHLSWIKQSYSIYEKCEGQPECQYIVDAALNFSQIISEVKPSSKKPTLKARSREIVQNTIYHHPSAQCRLDTFIASLNCLKESELVIDDQDYRIGSCLKEYHPQGARPSCWFNSKQY